MQGITAVMYFKQGPELKKGIRQLCLFPSFSVFLGIPKFQEFYFSGANRLKGIDPIFVTYIYSFSVVLFWYEKSCLQGLLKMIYLLFI